MIKSNVLDKKQYNYLKILENIIKSKSTRTVVDYPDLYFEENLLTKKYKLEFFE